MTQKKYVIKKGEYYLPSKEMRNIANLKDKNIYKKALKDPIKFWRDLARNNLTWEEDFEDKNTYVEKIPYFQWFKGGKLNFSTNCIDRHLDKPNHPALIWIPEPLKEKKVVLTYQELYDKVNKFSNVLKNNGVKKGDVVSIYLPMIPESLIAMLACSRIGAIHSVVFSAFSSDALNARIIDGKARILITADGYYRKGKKEDLLEKALKAIKNTQVKKIISVPRLKNKISNKKVLDFNEEIKKVSSYCKPEIMNSEDPLFILYTSGTTGKPKGIIHDTGGYAIQAYQTALWNFDLHESDVMWCTADIGWITGHTYAFYGPLLVGSTTLIYEGSPDFPNWNRWWKIIEENKVNIFYTAPTAIRMFMRVDKELISKHNLSSLRILGSVGEPIDKESWLWYFKNIGSSLCPIIDTWWQTETGGTLINVFPGIGPFIPTVSGKSFPGTFQEIVDKNGKKIINEKTGFLIQKSPFAPGMLHGIWNNHEKYVETYWKNFKKYYDTSDGAFYTKGLIRITGRTDDVMKVAGHRLSTAEIENAIHDNIQVSDVAVVPAPDKIKGETPIAFVVLKNLSGVFRFSLTSGNKKAKRVGEQLGLHQNTKMSENMVASISTKSRASGNFENQKRLTPNKTSEKESQKLEDQIKKHVDEKIGPIARPSKIFFVSDLPKTRSGKIMRRILKSLLINEEPQGLITLVNPECIEEIKRVIK